MGGSRRYGLTSETDLINLETDGFVRAGAVGYTALNLQPPTTPPGRIRHKYGEGPFARLLMPALPNEPGVYLWQEDDEIVYVGQTKMPLKKRLGFNGYAAITGYNTLAREHGKRNGGQQTNCRVNALANDSLRTGRRLAIWHRVTAAEDAAREEGRWMGRFGVPRWNRRIERAED